MTMMNAPIERWCPTCGKYFEPDFDFSPLSKIKDPEERKKRKSDIVRRLYPCPICGQIPRKSKCNRCGKEWNIATGIYAGTCNSCKSPYFNSKRTNDIQDDRRARKCNTE